MLNNEIMNSGGESGGGGGGGGGGVTRAGSDKVGQSRTI